MKRILLALAVAVSVLTYDAPASAQYPTGGVVIRGDVIRGTEIRGWPIVAPGGIIGPLPSIGYPQRMYYRELPNYDVRTVTTYDFDYDTGTWVLRNRGRYPWNR